MKIQLVVQPPFGPEIVSNERDVTDSEYELLVNMLEASGEYDYMVIETANGTVYLRGSAANDAIYYLNVVAEAD